MQTEIPNSGAISSGISDEILMQDSVPCVATCAMQEEFGSEKCVTSRVDMASYERACEVWKVIKMRLEDGVRELNALVETLLQEQHRLLGEVHQLREDRSDWVPRAEYDKVVAELRKLKVEYADKAERCERQLAHAVIDHPTLAATMTGSEADALVRGFHKTMPEIKQRPRRVFGVSSRQVVRGEFAEAREEFAETRALHAQERAERSGSEGISVADKTTVSSRAKSVSASGKEIFSDRQGASSMKPAVSVLKSSVSALKPSVSVLKAISSNASSGAISPISRAGVSGSASPVFEPVAISEFDRSAAVTEDVAKNGDLGMNGDLRKSGDLVPGDVIGFAKNSNYTQWTSADTVCSLRGYLLPPANGRIGAVSSRQIVSSSPAVSSSSAESSRLQLDDSTCDDGSPSSRAVMLSVQDQAEFQADFKDPGTAAQHARAGCLLEAAPATAELLPGLNLDTSINQEASVELSVIESELVVRPGLVFESDLVGQPGLVCEPSLAREADRVCESSETVAGDQEEGVEQPKQVRDGPKHRGGRRGTLRVLKLKEAAIARAAAAQAEAAAKAQAEAEVEAAALAAAQAEAEAAAQAAQAAAQAEVESLALEMLTPEHEASTIAVDKPKRVRVGPRTRGGVRNRRRVEARKAREAEAKQALIAAVDTESTELSSSSSSSSSSSAGPTEATRTVAVDEEKSPLSLVPVRMQMVQATPTFDVGEFSDESELDVVHEQEIVPEQEPVPELAIAEPAKEERELLGSDLEAEHIVLEAEPMVLEARPVASDISGLCLLDSKMSPGTTGMYRESSQASLSDVVYAPAPVQNISVLTKVSVLAKVASKNDEYNWDEDSESGSECECEENSEENNEAKTAESRSLGSIPLAEINGQTTPNLAGDEAVKPKRVRTRPRTRGGRRGTRLLREQKETKLTSIAVALGSVRAVLACASPTEAETAPAEDVSTPAEDVSASVDEVSTPALEVSTPADEVSSPTGARAQPKKKHRGTKTRGGVRNRLRAEARKAREAVEAAIMAAEDPLGHSVPSSSPVPQTESILEHFQGLFKPVESILEHFQGLFKPVKDQVHNADEATTKLGDQVSELCPIQTGVVVDSTHIESTAVVQDLSLLIPVTEQVPVSVDPSSQVLSSDEVVSSSDDMDVTVIQSVSVPAVHEVLNEGRVSAVLLSNGDLPSIAGEVTEDDEPTTPALLDDEIPASASADAGVETKPKRIRTGPKNRGGKRGTRVLKERKATKLADRVTAATIAAVVDSAFVTKGLAEDVMGNLTTDSPSETIVPQSETVVTGVRTVDSENSAPQQPCESRTKGDVVPFSVQSDCVPPGKDHSSAVEQLPKNGVSLLLNLLLGAKATERELVSDCAVSTSHRASESLGNPRAQVNSPGAQVGNPGAQVNSVGGRISNLVAQMTNLSAEMSRSLAKELGVRHGPVSFSGFGANKMNLSANPTGSVATNQTALGAHKKGFVADQINHVARGNARGVGVAATPIEGRREAREQSLPSRVCSNEVVLTALNVISSTKDVSQINPFSRTNDISQINPFSRTNDISRVNPFSRTKNASAEAVAGAVAAFGGVPVAKTGAVESPFARVYTPTLGTSPFVGTSAPIVGATSRNNNGVCTNPFAPISPGCTPNFSSQSVSNNTGSAGQTLPCANRSLNNRVQATSCVSQPQNGVLRPGSCEFQPQKSTTRPPSNGSTRSTTERPRVELLSREEFAARALRR